MAKKFVKRTDANNEILYFYTHSDAVDVGEGNATTSLTNALNNKANTSDVQALSDDALRKSPQSLSSQEKSQVHNNIGTESFVDDRAVRYDDAQVLGSEEKTQALTNLGLNGVDDEPTPNSDNLVKSGGVQNELALGAVYDVSAKNPTAGSNNDGKFESLSALLSDANINTLIPIAVRKGGMSIKFVQSSDNKYVQYRLMSSTWSTVIANWQGVDDEPIAGSNNLINSNGASIPQVDFKLSDLTIRTQPSGYKLSNDGLLVVDSAFKLIKYSVTEGTLLRLKLSKDGDGVYQFQDSDGMPSSGTNTHIIGSTITNAADGTVRVPAGATHLIVAQLISNVTNIAKACNNRVDDEPIENSGNLISSGGIYELTKNNKLFSNEGSYIRRTDGKEHNNTLYSHTDFLPILEGGSYIAKVYDSGNNSTLKISACQIYDSDKANLGSFYNDGIGVKTISFNATEIFASFPTAKYMILSGRIASSPYIIGVDVAEAFKKIEDLSQDISDVDSKIGKDTEDFIYTSENFSGVAYNTSSENFVNAGPTTDSIIIEVVPGKTYKSSLEVRLCNEEPASRKDSSIITRVIESNENFTCNDSELWAFINVRKSTFTNLKFTEYGSGIYQSIDTIKTDISNLNASIANIEENTTQNTLKIRQYAAEYDAVNICRERQLRQKYWEKVNNEQYIGKWYGVEFTEGDNPDNVTAINSTGDDNLHTTLPIQNKMRRCVTKDNIVQYYLDADNSELKVDGAAANLDGTDGNVMVEIPEFFYKIEEETVSDVRTIRIKISEDALPDFIFSPRRYTSAYEATINRANDFLVSVCTTNFTRNSSETVMTESGSYIQGNSVNRGSQKTARRNGHTANAATYRGGTNDATYDSYENPSDGDFSRNQLGLPVAYINREDIRTACNEHQFGYLYDTQKALYMLIQVEFKTRNIQKSIANGGLGLGATQYPSYSAYESFFKPQGGISVLPCGITNALGNHSGEIYYLMENVPISQSGSGDEITYIFGNVWMPCMSYRGVEHYYGHLYKIADQVDCMTSPTTGYVEGHENDKYYSLHDVTWWYEKNPYLAKIGISDNEKNRLGTWNFACHIMTVSSLLMGKEGHVLHIGADGKSYSAYYCDCSELDSRSGKLKYITFNGRIVSGKLVGNHFIVSYNTINGGDARPSDGTRLDHF